MSGIGKRLRRTLLDLLQVRETSRGGKPSTNPNKAAQSITSVRKPSAAAGASHCFIDLSAIPSVVPTWSERSAKGATLVVERVLARRLRSSESYTSLDGQVFILALDRGSSDAAASECAAIAAEIEGTLLGKISGEPRVAKHGLFTGSDVPGRSAGAQEDGPDSLDGRAGGRSSSSSLPPSGDDTTASTPSKLEGGPVWVPISRTDDSPGTQRQNGDSIRAAHLAGAPQASSTQFVYRQFWQPERAIISAYLCSPSNSDMVELSPYARDWACLQQVTRDIRTSGSLVILPLHYTTLARTAARHELVQSLSTLGAEQRRLLVIEIIGVPDGALPTRIVPIVTALRAYCRSVLLQAEWGLQSFDPTTGGGALALGLDLRGHDEPELETIRRFQKLESLARAAKLRTYVGGLRSRSLVVAALSLNVHYIEGEAVAPALHHLAGIEAFNLFDFYTDSSIRAKTLLD